MTVSPQQQTNWPMARKILWVILFLIALAIFAPGYSAALRPAEGQVFDFLKNGRPSRIA